MLTEQGRVVPTIAIYKPQHLLCTPVSGVHGGGPACKLYNRTLDSHHCNERAKGRAVYSRVVHGDLLESHDPQAAKSDNLTKQIIIRPQVILQRNPTRGQADEGLPRDDHTPGDHFLQSIAVSAQRKIPDGLCCRLPMLHCNYPIARFQSSLWTEQSGLVCFGSKFPTFVPPTCLERSVDRSRHTQCP